jgi:hypothetical protein
MAIRNFTDNELGLLRNGFRRTNFEYCTNMVLIRRVSSAIALDAFRMHVDG